MRSVQPRSLPGSPPESLLTAKTERTVRISWVSMMTTKGVISTDPLGVAGRATCRPLAMGWFQPTPSPLATSALPPRLNETLHHFMASMTVTRGGWFQPTPFCVAGRAMVVSRFTSLHDDDKGGRITRPPLSWSGRATCRTLWRWGHFNWPHPLRQPQSYRQD